MIQVLLYFGLTLILSACGQKSEIRNAIKAETTAEAFGDGQFVIRPLIMPLANHKMRFDSPVERIDSVAGGFAKMFMDLGAGMGMGKMQLSMVQPIPQIPSEYIKGLKIKRLFLYIEPTAGDRWRSWYRRVVTGDPSISFKFLDKLAMRIASTTIPKITSWYPVFDYKKLKNKDFSPLQAEFENGDQLYSEDINLTPDKAPIILKYARENRDRYLKNQYGSIYILNAKEPVRTKNFLMDHPKLKGYFKRIHLLEESLVVELKDDPALVEGFRVLLSEDMDQMAKFGIGMVEECAPNTCLDLEPRDVDLLPWLLKSNGLKIDAYINADKVPGSFKLKGFAEFEVKIKLTF